MTSKQRLDLELVARGLVASRQQAQQLIRAGLVRSGDQVLDKPGTEVRPHTPLQVQEQPRFVSRGGDKLAAALEGFALPVLGRICLDGGISTGGFSDCLRQAGALVGVGPVDVEQASACLLYQPDAADELTPASCRLSRPPLSNYTPRSTIT